MMFTRIRVPSKIILRSFSTVLPHTQSPIVPQLKFFNAVNSDGPQISTFRILDGSGNLLDGATLPEINEEFAKSLYSKMLILPALDNILLNIQRQGKTSFHMTSHGEEATVIGIAAALQKDDEVLSQYREMGILLWRGFGLDEVMAQCLGTVNDTSSKGKQMPIHFGSPKYHFHSVSSPLATQIPHAAGVGYALRRTPNRSHNVAACIFGEGAASEGDFHAGLSLASTLSSPVVFIVRNNGFAISTPSTEQYGGDGIASRGPGYGIDTVRVDGNDVLAVLTAVKEARERSLAQGRAVLVEAMTYRVGHHSTSDDSFAYRARKEVEDRKRLDNPLERFRLFMVQRGWWNEHEEEELKGKLKSEVLKAFKKAETMSRPELGELFTDVYAGEEPWTIREQRKELASLIDKYGDSWEPWKNELAKFKNNGKDLKGQ